MILKLHEGIGICVDGGHMDSPWFSAFQLTKRRKLWMKMLDGKKKYYWMKQDIRESLQHHTEYMYVSLIIMCIRQNIYYIFFQWINGMCTKEWNAFILILQQIIKSIAISLLFNCGGERNHFQKRQFTHTVRI